MRSALDGVPADILRCFLHVSYVSGETPILLSIHPTLAHMHWRCAKSLSSRARMSFGWRCHLRLSFPVFPVRRWPAIFLICRVLFRSVRGLVIANQVQLKSGRPREDYGAKACHAS